VEEAIGQLAGSGVLGAILVVLGWAYHRQGQELAKVQEARVGDAKRVVETLLTLQDRWQGTVNDLTDAVHRLPAAESAKQLPRRNGG
jgi:hypothetical protein